MRKGLIALLLVFAVIMCVSCSLRGNDGESEIMKPSETDKGASHNETISGFPTDPDYSSEEDTPNNSGSTEAGNTEIEPDVNIPNTDETEEATSDKVSEEQTSSPETSAPETNDPGTDTANTEPSQNKEYVFEFVNERDSSYGSYPSGDAWYLMYTMRIPRVEVSNEIDDTVNDEILNKFYYPALDKISQKKASFDINYRVYINGDLLSLLVVEFESIGDVGYTIYTVTINTNTKSILTLSEVSKYQDRDYASLFDGLEEPSKDLFYINDKGELILFDMRFENTGDSQKQYFLYNVDLKNENNDLEELKKDAVDDSDDFIEADIDSSTSASLINDAYHLLKTSSYSVAKDTAIIRHEKKDEVNNIQVIFETDDENIRVAVNFYRTRPGAEWKLLPGVPISLYERTRPSK